MKKKRILSVLLAFAMLIALALPVATPVSAATVNIKYRTHIQNVGWQGWKYNGAISGTTNQSLRLEAIKIDVGSTYNPYITYRTHIQKLGWSDWTTGGNISGTSGKSLRLEAIQIKLTGVLASQYDVYYRVHAQSYGWLGWAKNGGTSGTSGYSRRLEAIKIVLVPKGSSAPGSTSNSYKTLTTTKVKNALLEYAKTINSSFSYRFVNLNTNAYPELIVLADSSAYLLGYSLSKDKVVNIISKQETSLYDELSVDYNTTKKLIAFYDSTSGEETETVYKITDLTAKKYMTFTHKSNYYDDTDFYYIDGSAVTETQWITKMNALDLTEFSIYIE